MIASLASAFIAAVKMTPIFESLSGLQAKCRLMYDKLDLSGRQHRRDIQQLEDKNNLLIWEKERRIAQQQEQLHHMEAAQVQAEEQANSMHDQLCCAHQQLQKQQEAFFQSAQMISSLKMQLASHQHKPAMSQPPSDSSVGNMLTPVTPPNSRPTMVRE